MAVTIPTFQPLMTSAPLPGLWRRPAPEGPKQANIEVDWQAGPVATAVQITFGAQSVVSLSQIASLYVDNARSGADVEFVFPDTGFTFVVPAHEGGLYPVLSNALMFYAIASNSEPGDTTVIQILNEYPAPIAISPATVQAVSSSGGGGLGPGAIATTLIAAGVNGTIRGFSFSLAQDSTVTGKANATIQDGTGKTVWSGTWVAQLSSNASWSLAPINIRFRNGLSFVPGTLFGGGSSAAGVLAVNTYYTVP